MKKRSLNAVKIIFSGYFIGTIALIIAWLFLFSDVKNAYLDPDNIRFLIKSAGLLAPLVLIGLQILQAVLLFIPGQPFIFISGFLFGSILGGIYSLIGITIGSVIIFYIGKKFGRPYVEARFSRKDLKKIDEYFEKKGRTGLFISRLIFFFPNDLISLAAGLTKISYRDFICITLLGYAPLVFLATFIGNKISEGTTLISIILLSALCFLALFFIFKDFFRIVKEIRKARKK